MKLFSYFLILVLSISTYVASGPAFADCRVPQGNSFVVVGEGQVISLLSEGKSLASHKIQDQDGLGTCYANTASVMMKSVLPGNPDISYLHAAVQSSTNGDRGKFNVSDTQYWRMGKENKMESFTAGGFICETVNALKKTGGACRRELSTLEMNKFSADLQETMFKNLGIYFDALNKAKQNNADLEKFKGDFILAIEAINAEKAALKQACEVQKTSDLPLEKALSNFLNQHYFNVDGEEFCDKLRLEQFKKLVSQDSIFGKDRTRIKPSQETLAKLEGLIRSEPSLGKKLRSFAATPSNKVNRLQELEVAKVLGKKIYDLYHSEVQPKSRMPICSGVKDTIEEDSFLFGDMFIRDMREAKNSDCSVDHKAVLDDVFSHNKCIAPTNLDMILNAVSPLMEIGMEVNQAMQNHLLNQNPTNGGQLKNLLFPGCYKPENLFPLANVSCSTYTPCASGLNSVDNTYYSGPKNGCENMNTAMTTTRKLIHEGLINNRALGVSVCTSFMIDPTHKTDYCKNKKAGVEKHTYHAMTVSGLRCSRGKMEYQLVNSWGRHSCPEGAKLPNSPLKCEKDAANMNTGNFWVTEDVMVDSMTGLSEIKNGSP